jgi:membrane protease subunit HflK
VRATLRYKINKLDDYMFNFHNVSMVATNILDNALVHATSLFQAADLLTFGEGDPAGGLGKRQVFTSEIRNKVAATARKIHLGIEVTDLTLDKIEPPRQVADAFREYNAANARRAQREQEAEKEAEGLNADTAAEYDRVTSEAREEATRIKSSVLADVESLENNLPAFQANPRLFMRQRLIETLQRIMEDDQVQIWFVPARADGRPREVRLLLNPLPRKNRLKVKAGPAQPQHEGGGN